MNNTNKIIIIGISIVIMFFISFICFLNDKLNYAFFFLIVLVILLVYLLYLIMRKNDNKTIYMRKIKRILRTYNSSIIYLESDYTFNNEDLLCVGSFNDLVKASIQLETPIMYLSEDNSSVFMVKKDNEILYYIIYENNNSVSKFKEKIEKHLSLINEDKLTKNIGNTIVKLNNDKIYKIILIRK